MRTVLVRAVAVAVLAEMCAVGLVASAVWLLATAAGRPGLEVVSVAVVGVRALALGRAALRYAERLVGHDAALALLASQRARMTAALIPLAPYGLPAFRRGDLLERVVADVDAVPDLVLRGALPATAVLLTGAGTATAFAFVSPAAAGVLAVALLVVVLGVPALAVHAAGRSAAREADVRERLATAGLEIGRARDDLAVFGRLDAAVDAAGHDAARLGRIAIRRTREQVALRALGGATTFAAVGGVAWLAWRSGGLSPALSPALVAVLPVTTMAVLEPAAGLVAGAERLATARAARRRVRAVLDRGVAPDASPEAAPGPAPHLRLDGVGVHLDPQRPPQLVGVDLDLPPGSRVLLTGPSGAGKTSLLAVLWGFVRPDRGRCTLDGVDVAALPEARLRSLVGGLWQDAHLPASTVREAVSAGAPLGDDAVRAVLDRVGLLDRLRALPEGWDTRLGPGGTGLSGGERRRLLLARALLAGHPVLLLDEPTEGLPPDDADDLLRDLLSHQPADRTVVICSHRTPLLTPGVVRVIHLAGSEPERNPDVVALA